MSYVLSLLCKGREVQLPRLQALSDATAGRFIGDDDNRLARPKSRANKLADVVQELAVIRMKLHCMATACDSRERCEGWHEQPAREDVVDRGDQIQVGARFQNVAMRASIDSCGDELIIPVHRQKDDSGVQASSPDLRERLKAVEIGHSDVQHQHVGPEAPCQVERLTATAREGHDVKSRSKKAVDRVQKRAVIVG